MEKIYFSNFLLRIFLISSMHTETYSQAQIHARTHIHTHRRARARAHTHTRIHRCLLKRSENARAHTKTYTNTPKHRYTYIHTLTYTRRISGRNSGACIAICLSKLTWLLLKIKFV